MTSPIPFPNLPNLLIEKITVTDNVITVEADAAATGSSCPLCSQASSHVQSHYRRTVKDLPCRGQAVQVVLRVRRFYCANPSCARKIFAEAFPELTQAYARRTTRFSDALRVLGFAIGAEVGAFVATKLGLPSNPDTLLRLMRTTTLPPSATPRILGVDDFALRPSKTYGTLLVDLERQRTIDVLPDRSVRQLARWLRTHPSVQVISRDRSGEYARGARLGAPKALQVADRFHVVRNLADVAERVLSHHRKALKQIHLTLPATSPAPLAMRKLRLDRDSGMAEWRAFVRKLRQDQVAVQAGLTLKWNNGPLEGHINRLKLLKRSMYGRANFDLLRQRVLYQQRECG